MLTTGAPIARTSSPRPRSGLQSVTAAGAVAGLAFVAQQALPLLNVSMRTVFALIAAAFVGVLGLLVSRTSVLRAQAEERAAREREVDALLACWPPPRVADTNAYDLGTVPSAAGGTDAPPYVHRTVDALLEARLEPPEDKAAPGAVTLVTSAAGAGKTRTAFEALRRSLGGARVLVPENRESLNRLLALDLTPFLGDDAWKQGDWVLWLDDVDRYLEGLELDGLDELRRQGVQVVGTLRLERLHELVASPSEQGRLARRLLARASVVTLPDSLDPRELSEARKRYPDRDFSSGIAGAFAAEWSAARAPLYSPPASEPRPRADARQDPAVVGAFVLVCLLSGVLVFLGATNQAVKPPRLTEQLTDRQREIRDGCGTTAVQPPVRNDAEEGSVFYVVARQADDCQESDAVHVLEVSKGRLRRVAAFQPRRSPNDFYRVVCRGDDASAPCLVGDVSEDRAFVGAWSDEIARTMAPFVVHRDREGFELRALETQPPVNPDDGALGAPVEARAPYREKVAIPAVAGEAMASYLIHDFALLQKREEPMLVRAFVWSGTSYDPEELEIVAARLRLQSVPALDACAHVDDLTESGMVVRLPPRGVVAPLLHRRWNAVLARTGGC